MSANGYYKLVNDPMYGLPNDIKHDENLVYIVAVAWGYVITLMAATEKSLVAGLLTFVLYGAAPIALLMWMGAALRRRRSIGTPEEHVGEPDRADTE